MGHQSPSRVSLIPITLTPLRLQEENSSVSPRLFECSNKTGTFLATEIIDFTQDDLEESDVYLLDTWDQVSWRSMEWGMDFQSHKLMLLGLLHQLQLVGWEAGNLPICGPMMLFPAFLLQGMLRMDSQHPSPWTELMWLQPWPQRALSHPSGGHSNFIAGFLLDWERCQ